MITLRSTWLVFRVWGCIPFLVGLVLAVLVVRAVRGPVGVPGRGELRAVLWPLSPFIAWSLGPGVLSRQHWELNRTSPRSMLARRLTLVLVLAGLSLASIIAAPSSMTGVLVRNTFLCAAMALSLTALLPATLAGVSMVAVAICCWFLGAQPGGQAPHRFFWMYQIPDRQAVIGAAGLMALGTIAYVTARS